MNTSDDKSIVEGHRLPAALVASINSGRWMGYRQLGRSQLEQIFAGERPSEAGADFCDLESLRKATVWWKSEPSEFYRTGPPGAVGGITAQNGVIIGDVVDGEALIALDYGDTPPTVKVLHTSGWGLVAETIDELLTTLGNATSQLEIDNG